MVGTFPWGKGTYRYTIPSVIPPTGAAGKLTMAINATQRWATGFSLSGNVDISPAAAIDESTDNRGLSFTIERSFTIKPRKYPAGTTFVEIVGRAYYNEGPSFTFRYNLGAGAAPSGALVGSSFDGGTTQPSIDVGHAPEPVVISTATASTAEVQQSDRVRDGERVRSHDPPRPLPQRGRYGADLLRPQSLPLLRAARAPRAAGDAAGSSLAQFHPLPRLDRGMRRTRPKLHRRCHRLEHGHGRFRAQGSRRRDRPQRALAQLLVRWAQGVGNGRLVVRGSVARRSRLVLQVRRPGGGPLLFKYLTASGAFSHTMSLSPTVLPPGAKLFPGGFVVSVTGTSGGFQLPLQAAFGRPALAERGRRPPRLLEREP